MFSSPSDTQTGNWAQISPLLKPLYGVCSYFWQDSNKVFVCGGADSNGIPQRACYFYNVQSNSYELKDSLPTGRALGKLVRVKDSLYLVGSLGPNWNFPDGEIFKYDPKTNDWVARAPTPLPRLHEMAVSVWRDSLIITIGGSTSAFNGATRSVRIYDPAFDSWRILHDTVRFPINITSAQAECIDSNIVVVGGLGGSFNNTVYRGYIHSNNIFNLSWKDTIVPTPFGTGVYRVGGGRWANYMLFGPAMMGSTSFGQIWGFNITDSTWRRFLPNTIDTAGNRPTIAVRSTQDSVYFYLFGGTMIIDSVLRTKANSERYSFRNPYIGISSNSGNLPERYNLYQNYPNPFNPATKIRFSLPNPSEAGVQKVRLLIYDILGREIAVLLDEELRPGTYEIEWDGSRFSSGIYFYKLTAYGYSQAKKMVLLK